MIALGARAVIHQGVGPLDASPQQNASECMHGRMKLETILEGARTPQKCSRDRVSYFLPLYEISCLRPAFKLFIHLPPTKSKAEINLLSFPDAPTSLHYNKVPVCVLELRAPISALSPLSLARTRRVIIAISHLEGNSTLPVAPPLRRRHLPRPQCITGWMPEAILSFRSRLHTLQSNFQA